MPHRPSPCSPACPNARPRRNAAARGFSFVELLFAVGVMGIGFIMLAALFPIGLQQTKLTIDETTAAANARGAAAALAHVAEASVQYKTSTSTTDATAVLPHTYFGPSPTVTPGPNQLPVGRSITLLGSARSFRDGRNFADYPGMSPALTNSRRDAIWQRVNGELLSQSNERNASVFLYRRDLTVTCINDPTGAPILVPKPAAMAHVIVINAQVATQSAYTSSDVAIVTPPTLPSATPSTPTICNLEPRPVGVTIQYDASGIYTAVITPVAGSGAATANTFASDSEYTAAVAAVTEGTYVVISDDRITAPLRNVGRMNGRIYRVGASRPDLGLNTFELAPGFEFTPDPGNSGARFPEDSIADDIVEIGVTGNGPTGFSYNGLTYNGSAVVTAGPAIAYVLGRGFSNPAVTPDGTGTSTYTGPAQDVAIYTTFIPAQ